MLKTMATQEGLLIGPSSGAVAYASSIYCQQLKDDDYAVIIFGDSGRAYLTKGYYDQDEPESTVNSNYLNSNEQTAAI